MSKVAIIQARMSSTRLPGKVLAEVGGQPMLGHVVSRARSAQSLDRVVVATSVTSDDDEVQEFCEQSGIDCFRGSRDDVLDRFYQAAAQFEAETIVRLTADCPLLDGKVIDRVHLEFQASAYDYVSNSIKRSYPDGLDTEVFSRAALERAWREARLLSEREHVTPYIWKHPELFRLGYVLHDRDLSEMRWTVDEPEDLEFIRRVYEQLGRLPQDMAATLELLEQHPELAQINRGFEINEGYQKSLRADAAVELPEVK